MASAADELAWVAAELAAVADGLTGTADEEATVDQLAPPAELADAVGPVRSHPVAAVPTPLDADPPQTQARRRAVFIVTVAAAIAVPAAILGVAALGDGAEPPPSAASPEAAPSSTYQSDTADPVPRDNRSIDASNLPPPSPRASAPPGNGGPTGPAAKLPVVPSTTPRGDPPPADLRATLSVQSKTSPPGYVAEVVVRNVGGTTAVGWRVSLELDGRGNLLGSVGADFRRNGQSVTFIPQNRTNEIPPGTSVRFTFEVRGPKAGEPTGCTINSRPCGNTG